MAKTIGISLFVACIFCAGGSILCADTLGTISVNLAGSGNEGALLRIGGSASPFGVSYTYVQAGLMSLERLAGTGLGSDTSNFALDPTPSAPYAANASTIASFCIDLKEYIYPGSSNFYDIVPLPDAPFYSSGQAGMGSDKSDAIAKLWYVHIRSGPGNTVTDGTNASVNNAAFQLAVWEIVNETGANPTWSLSTGSFLASGAVTSPVSDPDTLAVTTANSWLTWVQSHDADNASKSTLVAFSAPVPITYPNGLTVLARQDQVVELIPPGGPSTPEPASIIALASMAFAAVVAHRIKRHGASRV